MSALRSAYRAAMATTSSATMAKPLINQILLPTFTDLFLPFMGALSPLRAPLRALLRGAAPPDTRIEIKRELACQTPANPSLGVLHPLHRTICKTLCNSALRARHRPCATRLKCPSMTRVIRVSAELPDGTMPLDPCRLTRAA